MMYPNLLTAVKDAITRSNGMDPALNIILNYLDEEHEEKEIRGCCEAAELEIDRLKRITRIQSKQIERADASLKAFEAEHGRPATWDEARLILSATIAPPEATTQATAPQ